MLSPPAHVMHAAVTLLQANPVESNSRACRGANIGIIDCAGPGNPDGTADVTEIRRVVAAERLHHAGTADTALPGYDHVVAERHDGNDLKRRSTVGWVR